MIARFVLSDWNTVYRFLDAVADNLTARDAHGDATLRLTSSYWRELCAKLDRDLTDDGSLDSYSFNVGVITDEEPPHSHTVTMRYDVPTDSFSWSI